jgi:cytochrome c biogenesis protein CcdA
MIHVLASSAPAGFGFGLVLTALGLGFAHGIDWDHLAAITDITSSQEERRVSLLYGTLYALGHALVILVLGALAILAGEHLPKGIDSVMTRVVGVTLLILGVYVIYSLIRHGRDFRLRSRWMLVFAGVRRGTRWVRRRVGDRSRSVEGRALEATDVGSSVLTMERPELVPGDAADPALWHHGHHGQRGHHHHKRPERDDTFVQNYGKGTSFSVGMIHGIGAETPTQVTLILGAATSAKAVGIAVLFAFVIGLVASNTVIVLGTTFGFLRASKNFPIYATVGGIVGVFSLVIGTVFVFGLAQHLPHVGHFFGG